MTVERVIHEEEVAIGTKVFSRVHDVSRLLSSVPEWISTVYIADDGHSSTEKDNIYSSSYHFDLELINLEYDAGIGAGRNAIVDALSEEFIYIVDPDHEIPINVDLLLNQILQKPDLGGIGGIIFEPDRDRLYSQARDFDERETKKGTILESRAPSNKEIKIVNDSPLAYFDWIPFATLFRKTCLLEQSWDDKYTTHFEHEDFYISHWKQTDWRFAISPSVCFPHYPGGDTSYRTNRHNPDKISNSEEYFLNKWGYEEIESIGQPWINVNVQPSSRRNVERAGEVLTEEGIYALLRQLRQYIANRGVIALIRQVLSYILRYLSKKMSV